MPGTPFADLALARRLEGAEGRASAEFVATRGKLDPNSGTAVLEVAGALAMFDGADSLLTQTFGLGVLEETRDEHLDAIETFFRERSAHVDQEICPLAGVKLTAKLVERGYRPIELGSVLYRTLSDKTVFHSEKDTNLSVRPINADEGTLWAETATQGWADFGDLRELMHNVVRVNATRDDAQEFLVESEGKPIAAGELLMVEGVALLAGACTIPEARRQGAQLALFNHRLQYARQRGCDLVMIVAEPGSSSQRNAERNGFRLAYTRTKWRLEKTQS